MKRILSSVLCLIMILTTVITALPVIAEAAYSPSTGAATSVLSKDSYKALYTTAGDEYVKGLYSYKFNSAKEMLDYELSQGYLHNMSWGDYSLYVNQHTGFVYYVNNVTGQILTSNPYDLGYSDKNPTGTDQYALSSQILVTFLKTSDGTSTTYTSAQWAGARGQIAVSFIKNGFRVNYTIGDTSSRLVPIAVDANKFEEVILIPMLERFQELLFASKDFVDDPELQAQYDFLGSETIEVDGEEMPTRTTSGYINIETLNDYMDSPDVKNYAYLSDNKDLQELQKALATGFVGGTDNYNLMDPVALIEEYNANKESGASNKIVIRQLSDMFRNFPITGSWEGSVDEYGQPTDENATPVAGTAIYALGKLTLEVDKPLVARNFSELLQKYTQYGITDILQDENDLGMKAAAVERPVFRCSLEYTFCKDGTLNVTLPANSIAFDESTYTLKEISPLQYFGTGVHVDESSNTQDYHSYAFIPDGAGSVTSFHDYTNINHSVPLYGTDAAYSEKVTKFEYYEQATMPVFGLVTETASNIDPTAKVTNGYFAIVEEGSALSTIKMFSNAAKNKYANVYVSYAPVPSDVFDLSETMTVGGGQSFTLALESKFTGSFVTNITMLTDPAIKSTMGLSAAYEATYSGMAARYRDFLVSEGTLTSLENVIDGSMPLYIEALGSIEIIKKYLTFPVNVNVPLTTFDDVLTMYNELAAAQQTLRDMADDYDRQASEVPEDDPTQKEFFDKKAAEYRALAEQVDDIKNVNFKLTGFANGGIKYDYPTKVKWEKACGGKSGFADLVAQAEAISAKTDSNLGIYPDFDFMFLTSAGTFSAVKRNDKARMIDNRYASIQLYDVSLGQYDKGHGNIINTASLEKLFGKFESSYSKNEWKYLSLSTFGSTLNSNFDEDAPVNRDESLEYVTDILSGLKKDGYSLMVDKGNAYTYDYVDHIVDLSLDGSHHAYTSYTVPFVGMVLHSYVNYSGNPINYSGSAEYDILKSIENGASLYYTLCYQNTNLMKDSVDTNKYYSVNYATWFERMVQTYKTLNDQIGGLQDYIIVDHKILIAEKALTDEQYAANAEKIKNEFVTLLDAELRDLINAKLDELRANDEIVDKSIKLDIDKAALYAQLSKVTCIPDQYVDDAFKARVDVAIEAIINYYGVIKSDGANVITVNAIPAADSTDDEFKDYVSEHDYFTNSIATDSDYDQTFYSVSDYKVVLVTYKNMTTNDEVKFVLNFNIDKVAIDFGGAEPIILEKYAFETIE